MSTDSKSEATPDAAADPANALFSFWTQWMEQSTRGTQAMLEAMQSPATLSRRNATGSMLSRAASKTSCALRCSWRS